MAYYQSNEPYQRVSSVNELEKAKERLKREKDALRKANSDARAFENEHKNNIKKGNKIHRNDSGISNRQMSKGHLMNIDHHLKEVENAKQSIRNAESKQAQTAQQTQTSQPTQQAQASQPTQQAQVSQPTQQKQASQSFQAKSRRGLSNGRVGIFMGGAAAAGAAAGGLAGSYFNRGEKEV